eukprot:Seg1268.4 transcript_id=Seg1268.4/GoldUCD/mRNA.D3Y31 product="hypothetical protein" protein_id=Seg1268.4/GoldUCD/D3Y31
MPSIKTSKSGQIQHPPTNRAFALRMMNSSQQSSDGRVSPLDKALKPIKDSFRRSKSKKKKEKGHNTPNDLAHQNIASNNDEGFDSSYELPSPREASPARRAESQPWSSQTRRIAQENTAHSSPQIRNPEKKSKNSHKAQYIEIEDGHYNSSYLCRNMEDIAEEDEYFDHNETGSEISYEGRVHRDDPRWHMANQHSTNGADHSYHSSIEADSHQEDMKREWYVHDTEQNEIRHIADENAYFVAPNGDLVRLRRKRNEERNRASEGRSGVDNSRTERFGKRLSLLCHMLAEKYPEDFHILELLVELQVSNEKREEEMNKSVLSLQQTVASMEGRLAAIERQSLPAFQQILMPLARAAGAFHHGIQETLSTCHMSAPILVASAKAAENVSEHAYSSDRKVIEKPRETSEKKNISVDDKKCQVTKTVEQEQMRKVKTKSERMSLELEKVDPDNTGIVENGEQHQNVHATEKGEADASEKLSDEHVPHNATTHDSEEITREPGDGTNRESFVLMERSIAEQNEAAMGLEANKNGSIVKAPIVKSCSNGPKSERVISDKDTAIHDQKQDDSTTTGMSTNNAQDCTSDDNFADSDMKSVPPQGQQDSAIAQHSETSV